MNPGSWRTTYGSPARACFSCSLYAVFTRPANGMKPVMDMLQQHLDYQISMEKSGVLFAAGPFWTNDEQQWRGEGMVVIRAKSLEAARAIASKDPMHASGARTFEVRPWLINEGDPDAAPEPLDSQL